jgi:transposase-like protein
MPKTSRDFERSPTLPINDECLRIEHEVRGCLGNPIEQDHRGIQQRYYPMLGFGYFESAKCFCSIFEEIRSFLSPHQRMVEFVSLIDQRNLLRDRVYELQGLFIGN